MPEVTPEVRVLAAEARKWARGTAREKVNAMYVFAALRSIDIEPDTL